MQNLSLLNNEKIKHRVKFSIRILLLDLLLLIFILSVSPKLVRELGLTGGYITILLMFVFIYLLIKAIFDIRRIFFHRVYITNLRLVYVKGKYIPSIKTYNLQDIIGVYFKSGRFDRNNLMTTFKVKLKDDSEVIIKNAKNGAYVAELLSAHLIKMHQKNKNELK